MKTFKRIISIIAVCGLLILAMKGFRFLVNDDTKSLTRITMYDFYADSQNIDVLFIGSSHCYRSYNPEIADDILGVHSFNLGTSSQRIDGSLALLKEAVKRNDVSLVILDIYYDVIETYPQSERTELTSTYLISDYLRPSVNKLTYLLKASSKEYYVNSFIVGRRSWKKLFDYYYVRDLVKTKCSEEYINFDSNFETSDKSYYVSRGFWANDSLLDDYVLSESEEGAIHIDVSNINREWNESLQQMIDLCQKKDIKLILTASPLPRSTFERIDNYDEYVEFVKEQLKGTGVPYLDFSLLEETQSLTEGTLYFKDDDHLNRRGADEYTRLLCHYLKDNGLV